jgi:hypothetical protein
MSDENKVYFSSTDPEGRTIDLHENTWNHIKEKHPEIKSPQEIKSTIQKPDIITEDSSRTSLAYTKFARSDLHVNVYTKMDDTYSEGRVSTAFLSRKPPKGDVIWVRKG